ncbi:methyl-accepting chemotaxis protein [Sporomusa sp. GT1]|uniref:methyl-accepting chemotaxis protein n=1 Tax=Sporomusa sp. GT1 TaxID=1534747 RepID=UPI001CB825E0|nr:methyl-accepting chemotaxis protein [Sporomusa sp. GT1]
MSKIKGAFQQGLSLKNKLLISLSAVSILPLIALGIYIGWYIEKQTFASVHSTSLSQLTQIDLNISDFFKDTEYNVKMLAANETVRTRNDSEFNNFLEANEATFKYNTKAEEAQILKVFENFTKSHPYVASVYMGRENGGYMQVPPRGKNTKFDPRTRPWYKIAMAQPGTPAMTDAYKAVTSNDISIGSAVALVDEQNKPYGVIGIDVSLKHLVESMDKIQAGEAGYVFLFDKNGTVITNPAQDKVFKKYNEAGYDVYEQIAKHDQGYVLFTENGEKKYLFYYTSPRLGWKICSAIPEAEITAIATNLAKSIVITIVITILITACIAIFIAKHFTGPISQLVDECRRLADGDLRERSTTINSSDEIGQLANGFCAMREKLRVLITSMHSRAEQLAAASEELTASADQSALAANQVAMSITGVATGAQEQLAAADAAAGVVEEMSASIAQIASATSEVAAQSAQAADKANEGNKSVEQAVNQMAHIQQTVNTSARVVAELGDRSKEIGQIVEAISGIASQTNLLALNAAIEAARAGEHGRGFAVVAEEVRKLAEQSQEATKRIAALVGGIQGDTNNAVLAMNEGTREVKVGADAVNAAGKYFGEIVTLVTSVSGQLKEVSDSIDQMTIGSKQIVGSVARIDKVSKKVVGESQTVSAATEEQSASMEEIAASSQSLAKLAMDLREAVSKFSV